jgi:biotin--protein ligase
MTKRIAIYRGPGTSPDFLDGAPLSPEEVIEGKWIHHYTHFIMPGGRDRPYHAALSGRGNERLRAFVEQGGTYIGLCAGAYYGASRIEFALGTPLEIVETRELAFFPGVASGPAFGTYDYNSNLGARAALISPTLHVYHNGGCFFTGDLSRCRILARYEELEGKPAAIIECRIGRGRALLSGPHIERSVKDLSPADPHLAPLIPLLAKSEDQRLQLWNNILN